MGVSEKIGAMCLRILMDGKMNDRADSIRLEIIEHVKALEAENKQLKDDAFDYIRKVDADEMSKLDNRVKELEIELTDARAEIDFQKAIIREQKDYIKLSREVRKLTDKGK